jgi:hypothetical protein
MNQTYFLFTFVGTGSNIQSLWMYFKRNVDDENCLKMIMILFEDRRKAFLSGPNTRKVLFLVLCYLNGKHVFRPPKYKQLFVTWMHTSCHWKQNTWRTLRQEEHFKRQENRNKQKDISEKHHKRSPRSYFAINSEASRSQLSSLWDQKTQSWKMLTFTIFFLNLQS